MADISYNIGQYIEIGTDDATKYCEYISGGNYQYITSSYLELGNYIAPSLLLDITLDKNKVYYLQAYGILGQELQDYIGKFKIFLYSSSNQIFQFISAANITQENNLIQITFKPMDNNFDTIVVYPTDAASARILGVAFYELSIIKNLIPQNIGSFSKIGVWTTEEDKVGQAFCINDEIIRLGRTHVYEIHNGVKINFLGKINISNEDDIPQYGGCYFNEEKTKLIEGFVVDYTYE